MLANFDYQKFTDLYSGGLNAMAGDRRFIFGYRFMQTEVIDCNIQFNISTGKPLVMGLRQILFVRS